MRPHQLILALSFAVGLFGYTLWPSLGEDLWFKCQAVMLFGLCFSYYLFVRKTERLTKAMIQVFSWCAFTNMVDELVFDPTVIAFPEYMIASFGIATAVLHYNNRTWNGIIRKVWQRKRYL